MAKRSLILGAFFAAFLATGLAIAQVPSQPPPPYNTPVPAPVANTPTATAVITNTARAAGTFNTSIIDGSAYLGITCTFRQTVESGSPSSTIALQAYDAASATFTTLATSPASTSVAAASPVGLTMYPGIQTSGNPAGFTFMNYKSPRFMRIQQIITGTNTQVTGTVGCDLLK